MKKSLKVLMAAAVIVSCCLPTSAFASTNLNSIDKSTAKSYKDNNKLVSEIETTTTDNANFRSEASTVDGKIYYLIRKGSSVTLLDTTSYSDWAKVKHLGKTGYVRKDYLDLSMITDSDNTSAINQALTTAKVNFRSKPSTVNGKIYYLIRKGSSVTVLDDTSYDDWIQVKHLGKTGYIHKDYLSN